MLSLCVGVSLGIFMTVVGAKTEELKKTLTPAEIVATYKSGRPTNAVVVRFRVRDVAESNRDWTFLYADELSDRTNFAVELSREARAALKRRGVSDVAKHFTGKEVEFEGRVKVVRLWCFPVCDLYTLRVESLEQLLAIRESDRPGED
jgi:hypothetical protein